MRMLGPIMMVALAGACSQTVRAPAPSPADTSGLEARRARHANDPDQLLDIGTTFYRTRNYARARDMFAAVLALRPGSFRAAVQLGLADEGLGELDAALDAYHRAQAMNASSQERSDLEQRLVALTRARLTAEARRAVADERTLTAAAPIPNTIAVLPWSYLGTDPDLRPLETGLAHLVVTDLSKVSRLTLLERERVQALADELKLAGAGRVEPATAARSGHLLRAARVVQGAIRETGRGALRLDADVVSTQTSQVEATGTAADRLAELFTMEKAIVLGLLDRLGIALSPAERRAIAERPTADLQAFLAFSRGLEAEDRGNFPEAAALFRQAVTRDPAFQAARDRAAQSARIGDASQMTPARLAAAVEGNAGSASTTSVSVDVQATQLGASLQGVAPSSASRLLGPASAVTQTLKSRLAEALNQDALAAVFGVIIVIIPRP
jgi:tetratricopeptide (TPR) repeat protein